MAAVTLLLHVIVGALIAYFIYDVNDIALPTIDLEECWGLKVNGTCKTDTAIYNFTIKFNDTMLSDLKSRLQNHRPFTPPLEGTNLNFQYGFNSEALKLWIKYLLEEYPFAEREKFLNQYPQYTTVIQGLRIHFLRVKSQVTSRLVFPLLILHGWPGSPREMYEAIPYLLSYSAQYGVSLDIIVPSLPGYAFSEGAVRPGMGVDKVAIIMRNLMHRLGYKKFFIQGGDMGAIVTNCMATFFPCEVMGYHTNFPLLHNPYNILRLLIGNFHRNDITPANLQGRLYPSYTKLTATINRTGYLHMQSTKPDSFGIGPSDSAAGLIADTVITVGTPAKPLSNLTAIQHLDNYMIYWISNSVITAMRLYSETFAPRYVRLRINEISSPVPTWVLQAPDELIYIPPWIIKMKFPNLLCETIVTEGGHFYAWTYPQRFAQDVVTALIEFHKFQRLNHYSLACCKLNYTNNTNNTNHLALETAAYTGTDEDNTDDYIDDGTGQETNSNSTS